MGAKAGVLEHEVPRSQVFFCSGNAGFSDEENYIFELSTMLLRSQ
jgi:hypothetical protein